MRPGVVANAPREVLHVGLASVVVQYWSQLIEAMPLSAQRRQASATSSCHCGVGRPHLHAGEARGIRRIPARNQLGVIGPAVVVGDLQPVAGGGLGARLQHADERRHVHAELRGTRRPRRAAPAPSPRCGKGAGSEASKPGCQPHSTISSSPWSFASCGQPGQIAEPPHGVGRIVGLVLAHPERADSPGLRGCASAWRSVDATFDRTHARYGSMPLAQPLRCGVSTHSPLDHFPPGGTSDRMHAQQPELAGRLPQLDDGGGLRIPAPAPRKQAEAAVQPAQVQPACPTSSRTCRPTCARPSSCSPHTTDRPRRRPVRETGPSRSRRS